MEFRTIQPWGEAGFDFRGSQYMESTNLYSVGLGGWYEARLSKVVSLNVWLDWRSIHDQIYLPAGDASLEDLLLRRRSMSTSFQWSSGVGLNFRLGSIYNNIVNRRLD